MPIILWAVTVYLHITANRKSDLQGRNNGLSGLSSNNTSCLGHRESFRKSWRNRIMSDGTCDRWLQSRGRRNGDIELEGCFCHGSRSLHVIQVGRSRISYFS